MVAIILVSTLAFVGVLITFIALAIPRPDAEREADAVGSDRWIGRMRDRLNQPFQALA